MGRAGSDQGHWPARDLLNATFTNLDLGSLRSEDRALGAAYPPGPTSGEPANPEEQLLQDLHSPDDTVVLRALNRVDAFNPAHVQVMERLIARDTLLKRVLGLLERFHEDSVPWAVAALGNEETEFVIRRRIPDLLARTGGTEADEALIEALTDKRFEVRYRAALALVVRRKRGLAEARPKWGAPIWRAVRMEVSRDRTLWELQNLLDKHPADVDDLVTRRVGIRGELSLEHTFRLLTLVLEPKPVRAAYHGVVLDDDHLGRRLLSHAGIDRPAVDQQFLGLGGRGRSGHQEGEEGGTDHREAPAGERQRGGAPGGGGQASSVRLRFHPGKTSKNWVRKVRRVRFAWVAFAAPDARTARAQGLIAERYARIGRRWRSAGRPSISGR